MDGNTVFPSQTVIAENNSKYSLLQNVTRSRNPTQSMDCTIKEYGKDITFTIVLSYLSQPTSTT